MGAIFLWVLLVGCVYKMLVGDKLKITKKDMVLGSTIILLATLAMFRSCNAQADIVKCNDSVLGSKDFSIVKICDAQTGVVCYRSVEPGYVVSLTCLKY